MTKAAETPARPRSRSPRAAGPDAGQIARRAHEIYLERGGRHGQDLDDWLQAERELAPRAKPNGKTAANPDGKPAAARTRKKPQA